MLRPWRRALLVAAGASGVHSFALPPSALTIGLALEAATSAFDAGNVPEAALSASYLLTRAAGLGNNRLALDLRKQETLNKESKLEFERMCALRLDERMPVQYILGDWDFRELTLLLRPPVLIPRPETEELVEHVLDAHGSGAAPYGRAATFLDVGCGSGAIGLAILHSLTDSTCTAIDVSEAAVALARENAEFCHLAERYSVEYVEPGVAGYDPKQQRFDVVVSNPPYIPRADMETLETEVIGHEDYRALCGGDDGLDVVRELLRAAPQLLRPEGPRTIWMEVDPSHPPLLDRWFREESHGTELNMELVRWLPDLYGRPRFCQVRWNGPAPSDANL